MADDIYREDVLDHYKNPRNFGEVEEPSVEVRESNASCGDLIELGLRLEKGKIEEIKFKSVGCAVSTAFASMLVEKVLEEGMGVAELGELSEDELVRLVGGDEVSATRQKCVRLGARALKKALEKVK